MNFLPSLVLSATLGNIFYLSLISLLPSSFTIDTTSIVGMRLSMMAVAYYLLHHYWHLMKVEIKLRKLVIFIPYLLILLLRFPLVYPTYDDLAVHYIWGDYANRLWQNTNFMPLELLNYFYLPYDMNYTPFLFTVGIRLTIGIFFVLTTIWLMSLYGRIRILTKTRLQRLLLAGLFIMIPFIPHMMAIQGTLMLEFFTLPFILEAWYQLVKPGRDKTFAALLTLLACLVKQSHAVFIAPLLFYYLWHERKKVNWWTVSSVAALASMYFVRLFFETGNPLSGLYNGWFKSSLYPSVNFSNWLYGPQNWRQALVWPIIGQFTERYAEGVVSMTAKIIFAPIPVAAYLLSIYLAVKRRSLKFGLVVVGYWLWSYLVGYARYYLALNALTVSMLIVEETESRRMRWAWITERGKWILFGVAILSLSSFKTDFAWRPNPSLRTPAANTYYLARYFEGLKLVGKDTMSAIGGEYWGIFHNYDMVMPVYRGPVTTFAYAGYLNGLKVVIATTSKEREKILQDTKIGSEIKNNLLSLDASEKIIMLVDEDSEQRATNVYLPKDFWCERAGMAPGDKYFQRADYFGRTIMYSCTKREQ